jgi:hypothetical protein
LIVVLHCFVFLLHCIFLYLWWPYIIVFIVFHLYYYYYYYSINSIL